ncbi:MAG: hypothetical protein LLF89_00065 [Spirochaetaceae bacterium]|nr:hypothetical protein [Spirochaetaceae bacterium]
MFSKAASSARSVVSAMGSKVFAFLAFMMVAGILFFSCSGKDAGHVAKEPQSGGSVAEVIPRVEEPVILPGIKANANEIVIAYKDTEFGFLESQGFDTTIFRFQLLPGGWVKGALVYERRLGGEIEVASYDFSRAGNEILVSRMASGNAGVVANFDVSPGKVIIRGDAERVLSLDGEGTLVIGPGTDDYVEEYRMGPSTESKKATIKRKGVVESEGLWSSPGKARFLFKESGNMGRTISLWLDEDDECRFRTEGVEPLNEVYAKGLSAGLQNEHGLENFALVDYVLGGTARNIRPVLAYLAFGSEKTKK